MTNSIYGVGASSPVSAYSAQQSAKKEKTGKNDPPVESKSWKGISEGSALVPTEKAGYGTVVGDVQLSDKAKDYYAKLKEKFHGVDFVLVSKDMKDQVEANASRYGNASKPIVLIDDEKIEKMANDPAYAKKYEGIIESSLKKLEAARNTLAASGATLKNFGMSVDANGKTSFFAVIEKASDAANKIREKNLEKHKAQKAEEKKKAEKKKEKERLEEGPEDEKEYLEFRSESLEDLIDKVSKYAFDSSASSLMAQEGLGQSIDFKG
ncbi:MAG: DUF6033 family protein [Lachnospiraceae bacterium]|nr:DUF6033 family protein [Lachnospiraceae bacterium]